jgi:glycosyl transferase, family 25
MTLAHNAVREIPIFVISLKNSPQRFQRVQEELARFGLSPQLIRGIDGRRKASLIKRLWRRRFFSDKHNRDMSPGEIGCLASHVRVLRHIIRSGTPAAIILEDDATFSEDFGKFYRFDLSRMLNVIDILKFEGHFYPHTSRDGLTAFHGATCRAIVPLRPSLCSAGYAVTTRGAESCLRLAQKHSEPYDFILTSYERHTARYCEVRPLLVTQSGDASVIGEVGRTSETTATAKPAQMKAARQLAYKTIWRFANAAQCWFLCRVHLLKRRVEWGSS